MSSGDGLEYSSSILPFRELGRLALWRPLHLELNDAWHQNDGLGMTTGVEHCELQGLSAIKENAAA